MKKLSYLLAPLTFIISTHVFAGSFLLNEYNLVTIGDVNATSMHVHGKTLIGGDLNSTNAGVEFGLDAPYENTTNLTVAGTISDGSGFTAKGYSIVDNANTVTNPNNANQYFVNGREIKNTKGVTTQDLSSMPAEIESNLKSSSSTFKNMTENSQLSTSDDSVNATHAFNIDNTLSSNDYAVFNLTASADIFQMDKNEKYEISANDVNNIAGVIINVAGTDITQQSSDHFTGFSKDSSFVSKIIWNFYEASTITLNTNFIGNILAPFANLANTGGDIDGSVGVLSIRADENAQIHDFNTTVKPPTEVPEPSTLFLFSLSALALLVLRKNRIKR